MVSSLVRLAWLAVLASLGVIPATAPAQNWPAKPVRIIVGFAAGGNPDVLARVSIWSTYPSKDRDSPLPH